MGEQFAIAVIIIQLVIIVVLLYLLAFYKAYFDQKQANKKIIEALRGRVR